ncbi:MAG: GNAT family N-acetyltransferase [Gemmatimonadaceae bacterium]
MTVETKSVELTFRPMEATEHDLQLFHRCFETNGSPRSLDMLRWQYFAPPAGKLLVDLAVTAGSDPRLAAIYAVFPIWMRAGNNRVLGVQSLNTLTDEAFRGKGLFLKMAASLYARAEAEHVGMVYGFPNGNSAHGFFKRLSWETLDPMPILIRPLRSGYVLRKLHAGALSKLFDIPLGLARSPKLPSGYSLRTVAQPTAEFDTLWERFSTSFHFAVERSAEYLTWRLQRPGESYEIVGLYKNETLIGYSVIGSVRTAENELVGKLMELVFDPSDDIAAKALVAESLHRLKNRECTVVWSWNFEHSPGHAAYRDSGFIPVPEKLQPSEGHVGVRAFGALQGVADRAQWYISMFDSDAE